MRNPEIWQFKPGKNESGSNLFLPWLGKDFLKPVFEDLSRSTLKIMLHKIWFIELEHF